MVRDGRPARSGQVLVRYAGLADDGGWLSVAGEASSGEAARGHADRRRRAVLCLQRPPMVAGQALSGED